MPVEWDKDCPKCGEPTDVNEDAVGHPARSCTDDSCNWYLGIGNRRVSL